MKRTLLALLLLAPSALSAQQELFFEDFEAPLPAFAPNTPDAGSVVTGDNTWLINNAFSGGSGTIDCLGFPFGFTVPATAAQPAGITTPNGRYLHTTSTAAIASGVQNCCFVAADGLCAQPANHFARMTQDVSTVGVAEATLTFWWLCGGGTNNYGEVYYSTNSGTSWNVVSTPIAQYRNQATWVQQTITLPAFGGHTTLRFGFRFVNGTTFSAQDPGFGIDDVRITVTQVVANGITTGNAEGTEYCQGAQVIIPYTAVGAWSAGNVFTAQLSDAAGSFAAPVAIGSVASTTSGSIAAVIPVSTTPGIGYRVRVVGSAPATTGSTGAAIYTVVAAPNAGTDVSATLCKNSGSYALIDLLGEDISSCGSWTGPGGLPFSGILNTATDVAGDYTYTTNCPGGCSQAEAVVSITLQNPANAGNDVSASLCSNSAPVSLFSFISGGDLTGVFFYQGQPVTGTLFSTPGVYDLTYVVYANSPCENDTANYLFTVSAPPNAGANTTFTVCATAPPLNLLSLLQGADANGTWTGPGGIPFTGVLDPAVNASGLYTYTVEGTPPCVDALAFVAVVVDPCTGLDEVRPNTLAATWLGQEAGEHVFQVAGTSNMDVHVMDAAGRTVVHHRSLSSGDRLRIALPQAATGVHVLRITSSAGTTVLRFLHVR